MKSSTEQLYLKKSDYAIVKIGAQEWIKAGEKEND